MERKIRTTDKRHLKIIPDYCKNYKGVIKKNYHLLVDI